MKQGRGRKNRRACVIPHPLTLEILKGDGGGGVNDGGITHARLFFPLPCFIALPPPLHPQDLPLPSPE